MDIPANAETILDDVIRAAGEAEDYQNVYLYQREIFDGDTVDKCRKAHDDMSAALGLLGYRWCDIDPWDFDSTLEEDGGQFFFAYWRKGQAVPSTVKRIEIPEEIYRAISEPEIEEVVFQAAKVVSLLDGLRQRLSVRRELADKSATSNTGSPSKTSQKSQKPAVFIPEDALSIVRELTGCIEEVHPYADLSDKEWQRLNSESLGRHHQDSVDLEWKFDRLPYRWCKVDPFDLTYKGSDSLLKIGTVSFCPADESVRQHDEDFSVPYQLAMVLKLKQSSGDKLSKDTLSSMLRLLGELSEKLEVRNEVSACSVSSAGTESLVQTSAEPKAPFSEASSDNLSRPPIEQENPAPEKPEFGASGDSFVCEGATWRVRYEGEEFTVKSTDGMHYLAYLLDRPNKPDDAVGMYTRLKSPSISHSPEEVDAALQEGVIQSNLGNGGDELMDKKAILEVRRTLEDLKRLRDENDFSDPEAKWNCNHQISQLELQLKQTTTPSGRSKRFIQESQSRADSVRKAIKAAIKGIGKHHQNLADHLESTIVCGFAPCYKTDHGWVVKVRPSK